MVFLQINVIYIEYTSSKKHTICLQYWNKEILFVFILSITASQVLKNSFVYRN